MTDPMQQQLLGHLLGALEDDEHEHVDALLEYDEECCKEWLRWRHRLALLESMRPEFEPPPGLAKRTCRYVASYVSALALSGAGKKRGMTACPIPPSSVATLGWLDVTAVAFILMFAVMLIVPAIDGSRFQSRLASCQDGLRQFGMALSQYGTQQEDPLGHLAQGGRLTPAGAVATDWIRAGYYSDQRQSPCPDAWLAAQGIFGGNPKDENASILDPPQTPDATENVLCAMRSRIHGGYPNWNPQDNWPGTWRDGTTEGRRFTSAPADVPLLADAPSADLPGLPVSTHRGLGRNVLFNDGHTDFLPSTTLHDTTQPLLLSAESSSSGISAPIVFVNR
jgi:hypothetical protein